MLKYLKLLLISVIYCCSNVYAQNIEIAARVIDADSKLPIPNVSVHVFKNNAVVFSTSSDSLGRFFVPNNHLGWSSIQLSSLNYSKNIISKGKDSLLNRKVNLGLIELVARSIQLKEVMVKSSKRYRDTTVINLSGKKFERSISINDLFSKNMGFIKDANGQLYYKGRPVSNITVNGAEFFTKDSEIYSLLPALILNSIKVIETNIDSVTNTTTLRPSIKVNLELKEKYNKGKFGNGSLGIGTSKRDVIHAILYSYRKNEQISLDVNSNNVNSGDNIFYEPRISFSPNGNNLNINSLKFTYKNNYKSKLSIDLNTKLNHDVNSFNTETERQDEFTNSYAKTFNSSNSKLFNVTNSSINVNYKIDSLSAISASQALDYKHENFSTLASYIITNDISKITSLLDKSRSTTVSRLESSINYYKKSSEKKGRLFNISVNSNNSKYKINELNKIKFVSKDSSKYFIEGYREAQGNSYIFNTNFTEPMGENGYVNFYAIYQFNKLSYSSTVLSDTITNSLDAPAQLVNQYLTPGVKIQRTYNKVSLDGTVTGMLNMRNRKLNNDFQRLLIFNLNGNFNIDYKINPKKEIVFEYSFATNYPSIEQLTNIFNTFDLVSQTSGNIYLNPEGKHSIKIAYNGKPSDSNNLFITGAFDRYNSKFGYITTSSNGLGLTQNTLANIGNSNAVQFMFGTSKTFSNGKSIRYSTGINYQELPTIIDRNIQSNYGITFTNSLSGSLPIIKSLFSINPIFANSYSQFFYDKSKMTILTLTYSDRLALQIKGFQMNVYPLFNYNHSISSNYSFSMNGEIKKNVFNTYGSIWLQAYDIFNSFSFYNNNAGSSYYQTVKYSTVKRYILIGIGYKFNNLK